MKKSVFNFINLCVFATVTLPLAALACSPGQYGFSVQGSSKHDQPFYVNAYAQSSKGTYNKTNEVDKNQSQEFCWDENDGAANVTKSITLADGTTKKYKYNFAVPNNGAAYKTIYIDSSNWTQSS